MLIMERLFKNPFQMFIEGLNPTKMCSNYIMKTVYTSKTNDNELKKKKNV